MALWLQRRCSFVLTEDLKNPVSVNRRARVLFLTSSIREATYYRSHRVKLDYFGDSRSDLSSGDVTR